MKLFRITSIAFGLFFTLPNVAQTDSSRFNIALSLPQLVSGTPELMADYFFSRDLGFTFNTGYTFKPSEGFIKVGDGYDQTSLNGAYYKIGLKLRIRTKKPYVTPFVQLMYVGSFYNEKGFKTYEQPVGKISVSVSGYVNGAALITGVDLMIMKKLGIKLGIQYGYYERSDDPGYPGKRTQPGIGQAMFLGYTQLIAGVVYKFN